ncbi:hypothetical protein [Aquitalea sp. LB_tupeE]|nr:hypothetical protein [Aquitalea sp. LB_tupeE]
MPSPPFIKAGLLFAPSKKGSQGCLKVDQRIQTMSGTKEAKQ